VLEINFFAQIDNNEMTVIFQQDGILVHLSTNVEEKIV
jgi:hypothetical protein